MMASLPIVLGVSASNWRWICKMDDDDDDDDRPVDL